MPDASAAEPAGRWFNERGCALAVVTLGRDGALATAKDGRCVQMMSYVTTTINFYLKRGIVYQKRGILYLK